MSRSGFRPMLTLLAMSSGLLLAGDAVADVCRDTPRRSLEDFGSRPFW